MNTETASPAATWASSDEPHLWRKLARVATRITFADSLVSAWYCATDSATPAHVRAVLLGALAYFLLPADAVPDLLAGIGFADDASVIAAVVGTFARYIAPEPRARARERLEQILR